MWSFQSVATWLGSASSHSLALGTKHFVGALLRRIWPRWPGVGGILANARTLVGRPVALCKVNDYLLYVDVRDQAIGTQLLLSQDYERIETEFVERRLREGMTFIDIGANIGYFTILAAKKVGAFGTVISFEPEPHNFMLLRKNLLVNKIQNVQANNVAVIDEPRSLNLYLSAYNYGDHRIFDSDDDSLENVGKRTKVVRVEGISLDDYLGDYKRSVNMIKVDVQGAEYGVLQGMRKTLLANPDIVLLTEFWPRGMRLNGTKPERYLEDLRALGFRIYQLGSHAWMIPVEGKSLQELTEPSEYTNLVCMRGSATVA